MKMLRKLSFIGALSLLSASVYAQTPNSLTIYYFKQTDPSVHEQFSCLVTGATETQKVTGSNHAEMITGFNSGGSISIPVSQLNSVYFDAYHDPNKPTQTGFVYLGVKGATIKCYPGESAPGDKAERTLMPGPYGKSL